MELREQNRAEERTDSPQDPGEEPREPEGQPGTVQVRNPAEPAVHPSEEPELPAAVEPEDQLPCRDHDEEQLPAAVEAPEAVPSEGRPSEHPEVREAVRSPAVLPSVEPAAEPEAVGTAEAVPVRILAEHREASAAARSPAGAGEVPEDQAGMPASVHSAASVPLPCSEVAGAGTSCRLLLRVAVELRDLPERMQSGAA